MALVGRGGNFQLLASNASRGSAALQPRFFLRLAEEELAALEHVRYLAAAGSLSLLPRRGPRGREQWQLLISGRGACLRLLLLLEDLLPRGPRRRGLKALAGEILPRPLAALRRRAPAEPSGLLTLDLSRDRQSPRLRGFTIYLSRPRRRLSRRSEVEAYVRRALARPSEAQDPRVRRRLALVEPLYALHDVGADRPGHPRHDEWLELLVAWSPERPRSHSREGRLWELVQSHRVFRSPAADSPVKEAPGGWLPPLAALQSCFFRG